MVRPRLPSVIVVLHLACYSSPNCAHIGHWWDSIPCLHAIRLPIVRRSTAWTKRLPIIGRSTGVRSFSLLGTFVPCPPGGRLVGCTAKPGDPSLSACPAISCPGSRVPKGSCKSQTARDAAPKMCRRVCPISDLTHQWQWRAQGTIRTFLGNFVSSLTDQI